VLNQQVGSINHINTAGILLTVFHGFLNCGKGEGPKVAKWQKNQLHLPDGIL